MQKILQFLKSFFVFDADEQEPIEIVHFARHGCMATDWREIERGVINGYVSRAVVLLL